MELSSYIVGFVDGEGTFSVSFSYRSKLNTNIEVKPSFSISQHKRNLAILLKIKDYFKVGSIRYSRRDRNYKYETRSCKDIVKTIIPFFKKNRLLTSKKKDFELFFEICELMYKNYHLNREHLAKIIDKAYQMNESGKRKYTKKQHLRFMAR